MDQMRQSIIEIERKVEEMKELRDSRKSKCEELETIMEEIDQENKQIEAITIEQQQGVSDEESHPKKKKVQFNISQLNPCH